MFETAVIDPVPSTEHLDLISQLDQLTLALTQAEHHAATILDFDPDAQVAIGYLAPDHGEPRDHLVSGCAMDVRAWRMLARACSGDADCHDDMTRLAFFLRERCQPAERLAPPTLAIGARVRLRTRPRAGGDRYSGREGVIVKTHFVGFYIKLDMSRRERTQKTELVETAYLELLASPAAPEPATV
ncbi:hypothetical protein [Sphingobium sp.]|uniref:hypothetical protein n=1 Tax=Sphingobium sp. TaxID=1912891 RepID=UPI002E1B1D3F